MRSSSGGMLLGVSLLLAGLLAGGDLARAEDVPPLSPPHAASDVDFWWEHRAFDDFSYDTGWVPSGSDVQVRFGLTVLGRTEVGLGGTADTTWPEALTVAIPGRPATGWLSLGYGIEITARLKIDVTILGTDYVWEGDLPFVDLPSDLLMAQDVVFDPFVLPGADPAEILAMDDTERVRVLTYDVAGAVGIPGVEGSISLDVAALLQAAYHTDRIDFGAAVVNPAPIDMQDGVTRLEAQAPWGYGPAADYQVLPVGVLDYAGGVTLYPHVTVAIGRRGARGADHLLRRARHPRVPQQRRGRSGCARRRLAGAARRRPAGAHRAGRPGAHRADRLGGGNPRDHGRRVVLDQRSRSSADRCSGDRARERRSRRRQRRRAGGAAGSAGRRLRLSREWPQRSQR